MTMIDRRAPEAPREDLTRMTTSIRASEDGNTLYGYAAVFNDWTVIDSWEGKFRERIAPGAFRKTLNERGDRVKVLFNHGMDPSIGDKPLGKPKRMEEDRRGLAVEVPLDDTSYNADIKALLRSGALDGMSFRMTVLEDSWELPEDDLPERTIKQIRLYEFGPVTFPAYEATQAGVRAHAPGAFEAWRSATGAPKTTVPTEEREDQQESPAGDVATEEQDTQEQREQVDDHVSEPSADNSTDEPPGSEHSSSTRRFRSTRHQRELTLAYVDEMLEHSKRRSQEYEQRVRQYERLTGKV